MGMSLLNRLSRLGRTLIFLRPVQIYGRLWFRLHRSQPDLSPAPTLRNITNAWIPGPEAAPSLIGPTSFRFLNEEATLVEVGWDGPSRSKLWRYNQHYFADLQAEGWRIRRDWHLELIGRWITDNPPGDGSGWEPYPISLRIVNWTKWTLAGEELWPEAIQSLAVQARALASRIEWHILGNHLFVNAKALLFAGHFFEGIEAAGWLRQGLAIISDELDEQFLPDGAQFELSPMYHALGIEDLLDLLNLAQAYPGLIPSDLVDRLRSRIEIGLIWLDRLSHPDGRISFFNDAAFGIAPEIAALHAYARNFGLTTPDQVETLNHMPVSGYARMEAGPATLIADLARIGPDYLPGHAHADTLSFELSLWGKRVFVNSGTGEYGSGPERQRQRGTAAHNTVTVAGQDSSEVWGGFRVGRRARIHDVRVEEIDGKLTATAGHDGYRYLPGQPWHYRRIELTSKGLVIEDKLSVPLPACARFHLHPAIKFLSGGIAPNLHLCDGRIVRLVSSSEIYQEMTTWHPEFGIAIPSTCLVLPLTNGVARLELQWE